MTKGLPDEVKQKMLATVPLGRMGTPEDIAAAVKFLASARKPATSPAMCWRSTAACTCEASVREPRPRNRPELTFRAAAGYVAIRFHEFGAVAKW